MNFDLGIVKELLFWLLTWFQDYRLPDLQDVFHEFELKAEFRRIAK